MRKTVISIEDDPQVSELIKMVLDAEDVTLIQYDNGEEGLAGVLEHKPDLILLDIMVPGMTGWQVHEQVRVTDEVKHIPIMILSVTQQSFEQKMSFSNSAVDYYLTKPFDIKTLRETVKEILEVDSWTVDGELPETKSPDQTQLKPIRNLLLAAQQVETQKRRAERDAALDRRRLGESPTPPKTGKLNLEKWKEKPTTTESRRPDVTRLRAPEGLRQALRQHIQNSDPNTTSPTDTDAKNADTPTGAVPSDDSSASTSATSPKPDQPTQNNSQQTPPSDTSPPTPPS